MQSKITQKSPTRVTAEVTLDWDKAAPHFQKALREIQNQVTLPGFRKGKAPAVILKRRYRDEITQEVVRHLVPSSIDDLIKEKDIKMVGLRHLHRAEIKENESFVYEADLDVVPEFELKPYTGIEVESLKVKVDEHAVEHDLEHMLEHSASDIPVEDRAVAMGDVVKADLTVIDVDAAESLLNVDSYEIYTEDHHGHPVLINAVIGMNSGEFKEVEFTGADDDPFVTWRGKNLKAYIEIQHIAKREKPELNDAFAVSKGFDNLKALKDDVRGKLAKRGEDQERDRLMSVVLGKIVEQYDFELPESMVHEEAENQLNQQLRPLAHLLKKNPLDQKTMTSLYESMLPQAAGAVRLELVLNRIADDLKIEIADEDLNKELEEAAKHERFADVADFRSKLEQSGRLQNIVDFMRRRASIDIILDKAKLKKVDALTTEVTDPEEEDKKPTKKTTKKKSAPKKSAAEADTTEEKPKKKRTSKKKAADAGE